MVGPDSSNLTYLEPANVGNDSVPAVAISFTPATKRRKIMDSFGYGLPEIIRPHDVTVPLLVGDQRVMVFAIKSFLSLYFEFFSRTTLNSSGFIL